MAKNSDNRMGWIRNLEALEKSQEESNWYEFEIASECYICGILDYANSSIYCKFLTLEKDEKGLYHYLLRIQCQKSNFTINNQYSKNGYYFKDGIQDELLSLFSIFFQCRFYKLSCYEFEGHDKIKTENNFLYKKCNPKIHPTIFNEYDRNFTEGVNNFPKCCNNSIKGLSDFLDKVKKLDSKNHQNFSLACWHYWRSLKEVSLDSEMVFIRLVSSIETLSKDFKLSNNAHHLDGKDFDELFGLANLSNEQEKELRDILNVKNNKIKIIEKSKTTLKFREFIKSYSEDFEFTHRTEGAADHIYVTPVKLEPTLKNIYDARSKYLHVGEPMYLSKFMNNSDYNWDYDASVGATLDNRQYELQHKLLYTYWFENLVRYCLLKWLYKETTSPLL